MNETTVPPGHVLLTGGEIRPTFRMRAVCKRCGHADGYLTPSNGQDTVRCANCGSYCYNAPKTETGRDRRRVPTEKDLAPKEKHRILERDNYQCVACGASQRSGVNLHVDHVLAVKDFELVGADPSLFRDPENLLTLCESCNLGKSSTSLPARLLVALILRRIICRQEAAE